MLYEICLSGNPNANQVTDVRTALEECLAPQGKTIGIDIAWNVKPESFGPPERVAAVVLFFGGANRSVTSFAKALRSGVPCLPIVSELKAVSAEIPSELTALNCISYADAGPLRIASATMEALGLLPRQRRVFVSYRRAESREVAIQLFDSLSSKLFDVFLDTHGVAPGDDFQSVLWHRLCDCDVLVMLDTPTYFESRWTAAEFGRALAKGISVLRIAWPGVNVSPRTATAHSIDLAPGDFTSVDLLSDAAIDLIQQRVEQMRSLSHAVRSLNMYSSIETSVQMIGGEIKGTGLHNSVQVILASGKTVLLVPALGVPTANTLQAAEDVRGGGPVAVVYDHVGLLPAWQSHLAWLGDRIKTVHWIKRSDIAWQLADLEAN
jgi:hypothetical protein